MRPFRVTPRLKSVSFDPQPELLGGSHKVRLMQTEIAALNMRRTEARIG